MSDNTRVRHETFHFANCVIRSDTRELLRDGLPQKIERRSFDLILYLLRLEGSVASKDELLEHVWGNRYVSDSVIAQSIMKVRKALGISGKEQGPIKTIHRVGYRFVGEVRRASVHPASSGPNPPEREQPRILWLPTECANPQAGLSWVRYGLISVVTHILQSQGVPTVRAGEVIRLYESTEQDGPVQAIPGSALGVVHSRLSAGPDLYRLDWQLHLDGVRSANCVTGDSPAEMAQIAAQDIALQARLQSMQPLPDEPDARFHAELDHLVTLAESLHQLDKTAPLLAHCVEHPDCPPRLLVAFLGLQAQQTAPATPELAQRLIQQARRAGETAHEGWAHLCLALYHAYTRRPHLAEQHTVNALALMRRDASGPLLRKATLVAAHILATVGRHGDAHALLHEAEQLLGPHPASHLVSDIHVLRCELACLNMEINATGQPFTQAMTATQRLGFQTPTAWIGAFCGVQQCAAGDFDAARRHLEAALVAGQQSGALRAVLHASLQLGNLCARTGDRQGLEQCIARLGEPALRDAPLGTAVWRWLRARHLLLTGQPRQALPLAEQAMGELADLGVWWCEDHWIFMAQVALMVGNRVMAKHLLGMLEAQQHRLTGTARHATILAVRGMLAYFDGDQEQALALIEDAHARARHTLMGQILLLGLFWVARENGRQPTLAQLSMAGHWVQRTREGQHLQAMLESQSQWGHSLHHHALVLGTGTDHAMPVEAHVGDAEPQRYADYLPMPV